MSEIDKLIDFIEHDDEAYGPKMLKWWQGKGKVHLQIEAGDISITCARSTLEVAAEAALDLYKDQLREIAYEKAGGHPSLTAPERGAGL